MVVNDGPAIEPRQVRPRRPKTAAMTTTQEMVATNGHASMVDDHVFLAGRPSLRQYLAFIKDLAVERPDDRALTEEWRVANEEVERREKLERGYADGVPVGPLPEHLAPLRARLHEDPLYAHAFDSVETTLGMVELDRLVVYQKHIDLSFARQLMSRLAGTLDDERLFRFCLPFDHPQPPVKWMRTHRDTFVFVSPSNDIRYLGTMSLEARHVVGYPPPGNLVGIVGLAVGFGSNFLNAIQVGDRIVLNNGSHRAYALRALGVTHVPCIVQHVSSREELSVVASSDLKRNPDRYLKPKRPPVLKDYFDPKLHRIVPCVRRLRQVRVKFSIDDGDLPAV